MASYYYATVRMFVTDGNGTHSSAYTGTMRTENPLITSTGNIIWYAVDVYKSSLSSFSAWSATVPSDGESSLVPAGSTQLPGSLIKVDVNLNTDDKYILIGHQISSLRTAYNIWKPLTFVSDANNNYESNSHIVFPITHAGGKEKGTNTCTPTVVITQFDTDSNNAKSVSGILYIGRASAPVIGFTTVVNAPPFPKSFTPSLPTGSTILKGQEYWSKSAAGIDGYWTFLTSSSSDGYTTAWICDQYGQGLHRALTGAPSSSASKSVKDKWTAANNLVLIDTKKGKGSPTATAMQADLTDYTSAPTKFPPRYNPPTHITSRGISMGERISAFNAAGQKVSQTYARNLIQEDSGANKRERGRIIQDQFGANALNRNIDGIKDLPAPVKGSASLWGFRFMYNPQTFQYTTASNNAVDWTLGAKDPATLLAGNQTVQFDLYLNRIAEMSYLKDYKHDPKSVMPLTQAYQTPSGGTITSEAIEGIINRGTEYDIEFLYRVLNGDPLKKPLLFGSYNGITSDFGYTTGTPCWLYLNDNMRYFGSVANLSVNHLMFDLNMVPMFTIVSVTFTRYPALWSDAKSGTTRLGTYTNIAQSVSGTTTAPATGGTG